VDLSRENALEVFYTLGAILYIVAGWKFWPGSSDVRNLPGTSPFWTHQKVENMLGLKPSGGDRFLTLRTQITKGSLGYLSSMYFSTSLVLGEVDVPFPEN